jgi:hypothetical protein
MSEDWKQNKKVWIERLTWGLDNDARLTWGADDSRIPRRGLRGNDYMDYPEEILASERDCSEADSDYLGNGFRLVCNARRKQC